MSTLMKLICSVFILTLSNVDIAVTDGCEDTVACTLYASEICTDPQYYNWTRAACPKFCGFCTATTENHLGFGKFMDSDGGVPQCHDAIANCADYGTKMCDDVKFYTWVNENCVKYCNRCDHTCRDTLPNCADYGADVCTSLSYYNWVEMHCRSYCARCTP